MLYTFQFQKVSFLLGSDLTPIDIKNVLKTNYFRSLLIHRLKQGKIVFLLLKIKDDELKS